MPRFRRTTVLALICLAGLPAVTGCSIKSVAVSGLASTFRSSAEVFASDNDPELVRDAMPFALKTMETLLVEAPENRSLLLSTSSGFTQYAYGFVQLDAELLQFEDFRESEALLERAGKLYIRGRDYGLEGLELSYPGITGELRESPETAVDRVEIDDIDLLFWTAAGWGSAVSLGQDDPGLVADLSTVNAMFGRCLELDPAYGNGSVHEIMIGLQMLAMDGGPHPDRARYHYRQALDLSGGDSAGPFLSLAASVSIPEQNRAEFEEMLHRALAVDPDEVPENRLQNLLAQKRARFLLDNVDEFFF